MVTTSNMDNNNSMDVIKELQARLDVQVAQMEAQAAQMEAQARTIHQQQELQRKQAKEIAMLRGRWPPPEMSASNGGNEGSQNGKRNVHTEPTPFKPHDPPTYCRSLNLLFKP